MTDTESKLARLLLCLRNSETAYEKAKNRMESDRQLVHSAILDHFEGEEYGADVITLPDDTEMVVSVEPCDCCGGPHCEVSPYEVEDEYP